MTALSVYGLRTYGAALFFATPFAMGIVTTILGNRGPLRSLHSSMGLAVLTVVATGAASSRWPAPTSGAATATATTASR